jgi:hypothetical protein
MFVSLPMPNQPLVRDGASAVIFDSKNPSVWRAIQADETLFWCAAAGRRAPHGALSSHLPCVRLNGNV